MHGAAGAVAAQLGQVERLGDHALAGERGVAVHQQRQDGEAALALALVEPVLLGPHDAFERPGRRPRGGDGLDVSDTGIVVPS